MNRQEFEAHYIAKHFHESLRLEELTYRDCVRWMQENWIGDRYKDEDIQSDWEQRNTSHDQD